MLVIIAAVLQILTPVLPSLGVGQPIGEQSDDVSTILTPAGWAFSIWGPLYAGSILFVIYQALPRQRDDELLRQVRWPATGAFLGNAVWAAYTQIFGLSIVSALIIAFTLICLLAAYRTFSQWHQRFRRIERWLVVLPLSALAAWLTVATIVNFAAALRFHGVDAGDVSPLVGAAVLVVGGLIALTALAQGRGNPPYALVFLWGLAAIYALGGQQSEIIAAGTVVAALCVIVGAVIGSRRSGADWWIG